jgi:hypothetical protein
MGCDYMQAKAKMFAKAFRARAAALSAPDMLTEMSVPATVSFLWKMTANSELRKGEQLVLKGSVEFQVG